MHDKKHLSPERIDLLPTSPSQIPFAERVQALILSPNLESKVLCIESKLSGIHQDTLKGTAYLTRTDEKELATEVLLLRHRFTELIFQSREFRQAALTIVQNVYLFRNRKIFFGTSNSISAEQERQEALHLFSSQPCKRSLSLAKSFQHLILARVWSRILIISEKKDLQKQQFIELHAIVEKLNTIRNIYILLTAGLVRKLATRINKIYKESISYEDAVQIGSFGIARAAYRYHQSSGVHFSTFAANWVFKEIQRQSLEGRLIKLSSHTIEQYSKATKNDDKKNICRFSAQIKHATTTGADIEQLETTVPFSSLYPNEENLGKKIESQQLHSILQRSIEQQLSGKCGDIIKRKYGFPPYEGNEQSTIAISKIYGVTRGSIHQLERAALKKLNLHLKSAQL